MRATSDSPATNAPITITARQGGSFGLPPLIVVGGLLSYALRRPHGAAARFAVGLAIGAVLFAIGQTGAIRF